MRRKVTLTIIIFFAIISFWLGEGELPIWSLFSIAFGIIGSLIIISIFPSKIWRKVIFFPVVCLLFIMSFYTGSVSSSRAFNECVHRGEEVREKLSEYYKKFGHYPDNLQQLKGFSLCNRILRPSLLVYQKTNEGYDLSFKDWLVEHSATQDDSFMAHK